MVATVYLTLLFVMATRSVVMTTISQVDENGDVMSILKTMQVRIFNNLQTNK